MAAVGRRDYFLNNIILLCVYLLIIMMSASSTKTTSNVLTTGQTLESGTKLSYANSNVSLVFTPDCDVILYDDKGDVRWKSRTGGIHGNCALSLTNKGRLVLNFPNGNQLWITPNAKHAVGKYIAVLRPEAELVIYGPAVWAVGEPQVKESSMNIISSTSDINNNEMVSLMTNLKNIPSIHNVLFSGQRLYNDDKIYENGYSFVLDDCELILKDNSGSISWQTFTHGYGINCFARLNYYGGLAIFDEHHKLVWKNDQELHPSFGKYALVVQSNGTVYIYGPEIWSSAFQRDGLIKMPTVEM